MLSSVALPIAKVSPFLVYQTKSLLDDLSCSAFSMPFNVDISVPHLIPLKPSGSERGLEDRVEAKQPIKKMLNTIVKILTFFMAPIFSLTILLPLYPPNSLDLPLRFYRCALVGNRVITKFSLLLLSPNLLIHHPRHLPSK